MKYEDEDSSLTNWMKLPIYKKAKEIVETVHALMDLIHDEIDDKESPLSETDRMMLASCTRDMFANATTMCTKIAGAEGGDLYDLRMENAAIIRHNARSLQTSVHSLTMFGFKEEDYFNVLRNEIEEFRLLFIDWVAGFDQWNYLIDRWGLFNPPGVTAHDHDPDDDIPFDPADYLGADESE